MYAVVMNYKCPQCQSNFAANDGKLLSSLPTYLRCMYPVNPIYATGGFHITEALSQLLENLMVTYANGDFVSKMLYQEMGREYTRKVATYLSLSPTRDFAGEREYESGIFPPSGKSLRELYEKAQQSTFTHYGYSHADRCEREVQSVQVGEKDLSAIDWTDAVARNFILPGVKAAFDMNKGSTKETVTLGLVKSVSVSEISHMITQCIRRRTKFKPRILYSDTAPHNTTFWKRLFGPQLLVRLGLFHLLHRITDTLDSKCGAYWSALVSLKACFYGRHFTIVSRTEQ